MMQNKKLIVKFAVFAAFFFLPWAIFAEEPTLITISDGISMVLKDSRLIRITLQNKDMALQNSLISRSALLPQGNANISQTLNRFQPAAKLGNTIANTADQNYYSYGFDVYQTLFDFGKSLSNYKATKELTKAALANIDSVKRMAVLEFIIAYFNLLETEKMILVCEKEVESIKSYLNDIQHLYEQDVVVENDLLPAQVRLADAKQKLIASRSAREITTMRLNNILGLPLKQKITIEDKNQVLPDIPDKKDAWSIAEKQRPEIAFYEDEIQASGFTAQAKSAQNLPDVFADAGYAYTKNNYTAHEDNAYLKIGAKINFYDGGAAKAEVTKEHSRQKQLKEEKLKLIEDIRLEIEDSFITLSDAKEKVIVAKDVLSQAAENVRVNRTKYALGNATSTDVLEAITLETKAQTNFFLSNYETKRSYAKLMYSMGIDLPLLYGTMEKKNEPTK